jgi:hypothetical protein
MKLYEVFKEIQLDEFWGGIEEQLLTEVGEDDGLTGLLDEANKVVFQKFNIIPKDKVYFIAGSARLYLHSGLKQYFGLKSIGDLDIVVPDQQLWLRANLSQAWNNNGIYRPTQEIEVFNAWLPAKSGAQYADTQVRDTKTILSEATLVSGYYFMPIRDIVDYKLKLSRQKEVMVVELINRFMKGGQDKVEILKHIINTIGKENAKVLFT